MFVIRRIAEEKRTDVAAKNKKRGCLASCNYCTCGTCHRASSLVDGAVPSSRPFSQTPTISHCLSSVGGRQTRGYTTRGKKKEKEEDEKKKAIRLVERR